MKRFFVTLLFLFPILLSAEGIPYNAAQLLLKSNLIVHGKVHRDEGKVFRLYVKEVWQDDGYGIKSGDYLKVRNTAILNCGLSNNLTEEVNEEFSSSKKNPIFGRP